MKKFQICLALLVLSVSSTSVFASVCSWSSTSFSASANGKVDITYNCTVQSTIAAIKKVSVSPVGVPTCSINPSSGYENVGSCTSPDVIVERECGTAPAGRVVGGTINGASVPAMMSEAVKKCASCDAFVRNSYNGNYLVYEAVCK